MTPLDAMRSALEALDVTTNPRKLQRDAITNLRTTIAELESAEPVARVVKATGSLKDIHIIRWMNEYSPNEGDLLFTHPAQSRDSIIEECAAVCEEVHSRYPTDIFPEGQSVTAQSAKMARITANNCALEIRALKGK